MRFAKWVFLLAGVSGVLLVAPAYFLEGPSEQIDPPRVNRSEYYYSLVGSVLAWQVGYLLIASDPIRFRPVMLLGSLGKASVAIAVAILYVNGKASLLWAGLASMDATWVILFLIAYRRTAREKLPLVG
jgi:hypothetical protein